MTRSLSAHRNSSKKARQRAFENIAAAQAAAHDRTVNPVEQAKTFLRGRGYTPVYSGKRKHFVGRHAFKNDGELIAFAKGKGWQG